MAEMIVFSILAVVTLVSGLIVVTDRNLFHAALAMMLSFLGVAGFYAMLGAGFMAAAQLLVYIGAISILVIFAIMMTRRLMSADEAPFNAQWPAAVVASVLIFLLTAYPIYSVWLADNAIFRIDSAPAMSDAQLTNSIVAIGRALVSADGYVLPFEIVSVLLLAALVGSIVIARGEDEE